MEQKSTVKQQSLKSAHYVLQQAIGFTYQGALRAAAELKLADCLVDKAKTAEELALETNTDAKILKRILRTLVSRNIFTTDGNVNFALNPEATFLCSNHPFSVRQAILMLTDKTFWLPANNLYQYAYGNNSFEEIFGMPFFDYWELHINNPDNFHNGMSEISRVENEFVLNSIKFPENITVADIGGGTGTLLLSVLKREPSLKGILFDTEAVLKKHILSQLNDDTRWQLCSGSFFEQCPEADIYLLKYITHDWSDEKIQQILHTIHKAMKPSSKLLIIDNIIPEGDQPYFGKEMDLIMMTSFSGASEHTQSEFSTLLSYANFKMNNVISTGCHLYIIEAVPV